MLTPQEEIDPAKVWREHIGLPKGYKVKLSGSIEFGTILSKGEIDILEEIWTEYGVWDRRDLVRFTHSLPEWIDPVGSSLTISFQEILAGLKVPAEQITSRHAEHRAIEALGDLLESAHSKI